MRISLQQADRGVSLMATRAHFGASTRGWTLEVPDLSGVDGFPARVGLQDVPTSWSVMAFSQPEQWYIARRTSPRDGDVQWSASAYGDVP